MPTQAMPTLLHARLPVLAAALLVVCLSTTGCVTSREINKPAELQKSAAAKKLAKQPLADRTFYRGTCASRQDIRDLFARVEGAAPHQWARIAQKLVNYGEPAVPQMMANLGSHQESVQVMAAYCLGMIQDPRALGALDMARRDDAQAVRHEAATAMLRMGDRRGLPTMIAALEDPDPLVRGRSIIVLEARTGSSMGFVADGRPADRQAAVARWRAWLARGGGVMAPRDLTPASSGG